MRTPSTLIDLLEPSMQADPHDALHDLRAAAPVAWSDRHRGWLLTRYDDVAAAFRDARLSADRMTPTFARLDAETRASVAVAERHLTRWLVFMDPPDHDRVRRLVSRAFTPPRMEAVRGLVRDLINDLLDGWESTAPDTADVNFAATFSWPLPTNVVAAVLGVTPEDYRQFFRWSGDVSAVVFGTGSDPSRFVRSQRGLEEFDSYLRALVDEVRAGRGRPGLVTDLVGVHDDDGAKLDTIDLIATCTLLLFAGTETTTTLLGNALTVLDQRPDQRNRIARDAATAASAVEELLRYAGPTKLMVRHATDDVALPSGALIPRGDRVYLIVAAANRDPSRFEDPDALDIDRRDNVHVGFGSGIHHCLGAPLARIETQEALRAIYSRFPHVRVTNSPSWGGGLVGRSAGPVSLRPGPPSH
jgi:cytochrome P450